MNSKSWAGMMRVVLTLDELCGAGGKEKPLTAYQVAEHSSYARSTVDKKLRQAAAFGYVTMEQSTGRTGWKAAKYTPTQMWREQQREYWRNQFEVQKRMPLPERETT